MVNMKPMKPPKGKLVFAFEDDDKRGFQVRLLEKGNPVPDDVVALELIEKKGISKFALHITPSEANAIACGLLHAILEFDNK